jgi:hypothetical protein
MYCIGCEAFKKDEDLIQVRDPESIPVSGTRTKGSPG